MGRFGFVGVLFLILILVGCGDDSKAPPGSQPGWSGELVKTLIACEPNPGPVCDCVIPQITTKYTPEQVREKSTYVVQDQIKIKAQCEKSADTAQQQSHPSPLPAALQAFPFTYEFKDNGCTTGHHECESKAHFCSLMTMAKLNQNCARYYRIQLFTRFCPGNFVDLP